MKIVVIDGQGGSIGKTIIEQLKKQTPGIEITAIGTNSIATSTMRKAGADLSATGENPILLACETADIIVGTIGIVIANSLLGEITPAIASAVGKSRAQKVLVPNNKCRVSIAGVQDIPMGEAIEIAVGCVLKMIRGDARLTVEH